MISDRYFTGLVFILLQSTIFAQTPNFQMGFTTGNLITLPNSSENASLSQGILIRYKAGILCRSTLTEKLKLPPPFPKVKKGVAALDYGFSVVAKGYYYSFKNFENTQDHWSLEIPVLLTLYDKNDRWLARKYRRKGISTFARFGPKLVFEVPAQTSRLLQQNEFLLRESGSHGGFNIFWNVGGGIMRNTKKGNCFAFHISGNIGFITITDVALEYADDIGLLDQLGFRNKGSYIETSMIYLFNLREVFKGKGVPPPVIYGPRY